jgi:hypothetical protein
MKVSKLSQKRKTRAKIRICALTVTIDIAPQIAKAAAYLDRTSSQFALSTQKAKRHLNNFEGGALVGPIARR